MAAPRLKVAVISPEQTLFEGDADMVVAPAWDGELGILRGHAPMLALLGEGNLRITGAGEPDRQRQADTAEQHREEDHRLPAEPEERPDLERGQPREARRPGRRRLARVVRERAPRRWCSCTIENAIDSCRMGNCPVRP